MTVLIGSVGRSFFYVLNENAYNNCACYNDDNLIRGVFTSVFRD